MAGGGNFMHRIISYVVNELVVNGLANRLVKIAEMTARTSNELRLCVPCFDENCELIVVLYANTMTSKKQSLTYEMTLDKFERFAVRTSKRIEDISNKATQKKQELAEQIKDMSKKYGE